MAEDKRQEKPQPVAPKPQAYVEKESANFRYIVRIANTDLDGKKAILMGLQKVKGISFMTANAYCNLAHISKTKRTGDLSDQEIEKLDQLMRSKKPSLPSWLLNRRKDYETGEDLHYIGADLTFLNENDLRRLKKIKSYRGVRHMQGAPVRGQRTRSNFRKNKGKVASVKRSVVAKAQSAEKAKTAKKEGK